MCWLMVLPSGRWNGYCRVEDGKWLMLLPLGRCYGPGSMFILILVLGCYTEPHPIYVADGIYQHFYLGMDYIRVNNPSLNRNVGKYHLPHIWDEVLYNIPELKLK